MKKFLIIVLSLIILNVNAEVTDTEGPVLKDFSFESKELVNNKTVRVMVDASDEISGASFIEFNFYDPTKDYLHDVNAVLGVQVNIHDGKDTYASNPINRVNPGTYKLWSVIVYDKNHTSTCYMATTAENSISNCNGSVPGFTVTLKDAAEAVFTEIKNFSVSKNIVTPGEDVTFRIETTTAGIESIVIFYDNGEPITFYQNASDATVFTKTVNTFTTPGSSYNLNQIDIRNNFGNHTVYNNNGSISGGAKMITTMNMSKYNISVEGEMDGEAPVLNSYKLEKDLLYAPSVLNIYVDATDNIENNIKQIQIDITKDGKNNTGTMCDLSKKLNGFYKCPLEINQYMATGEYKISTIIVTDKSNNMVIYSANPIADYKKLEEKSFTIDTDIKSDIVSRTDNEELPEKIEKSSDNAIISLDSTRNSIVKKKIFDSIKGTNKILYIESNGIQWIFNGSKINNPTKDIDVKVNIFKKEQSNVENAIDSLDSLVVSFASNGKLPGIAKVRIKADYTFRNFIGTKDLYVYYYDEENEMFEPVAQKIDMTSDGYYEFFIEHNSKYIISKDKPAKKFVSNNTSNLKINNNTKINKEYNVDTTGENVTIIDNKTLEEPTTTVAAEKVTTTTNPIIVNQETNNMPIWEYILIIIFASLTITILYKLNIIKVFKDNK